MYQLVKGVKYTYRNSRWSHEHEWYSIRCAPVS